MHNIRYRRVLITGLCFFLILMTMATASEQPKEVSKVVPNPDVNATQPSDPGLAWTKIPMTDAVTGEQFSIDQIAKMGKPVLIHTFAVWCPTCSMQLGESEQMLTTSPDSFTIVGIDIDPNENQNMVKKHIEKEKYAGHFAAAPKELTRGMVGTFGTSFALELPQTVIVCNKTVNHLGSGLFRAQTLKSALSQVCA
ncbi:TlpA family protein disulfide reductase [Methanospirillum lacunae]|uniref:Thioredoxin domain-containing protein n=1 Tax=Methanospirillum lacunae TaxID=668570 RepID=A0A2V2MNW1_9EURY|nr:thioredoxin domain-containing protein [Methanospirillum lacunae]PWR69914.1 hypothetical protein DK846_15875 [Methanospirillum lacunae]